VNSVHAQSPLHTRPQASPKSRLRPRSAPSGGRPVVEKQGWPYTGRKEVTSAGPGHAAARRDRKPKDDPLYRARPRAPTDAERRGSRPSEQTPECLLDRVWRFWATPDCADRPEMTIENFLFVLSKADFFSGRLTVDAAQAYLEALTHSETAAILVVKTHKRYSRGVSYVQFAGALQEFASILGITYAECVSKLVHAETAISKLKFLFRRFCSSAKRDRMTVSDFSKFCERFNLFVERQFCHADIYLMLRQSGEKSRLDYDDFLSLLAKIAGTLRIDWNVFSSALTVRASELGLLSVRHGDQS